MGLTSNTTIVLDDAIAKAQSEILRLELSVVEARAALEVLLLSPPRVGDVYWYGHLWHTQVVVKAIVEGKLWLESLDDRTDTVMTLKQFNTSNYERYVP